MSSIINDIVEEINIKPNKNKLVLQWVLGLSSLLVSIAFVLGYHKANVYDKLEFHEKIINKNSKNIELLNREVGVDIKSMKSSIDIIDNNFNKIFDSELGMFVHFQEYHNEQLDLIIDYGNGEINKTALKKMLGISDMQKKIEVEMHIDETKNNLNKIDTTKH